MFKSKIAVLTLGCALSVAGYCGVGQQSGSVEPTTPVSTDDPSIANQPVPANATNPTGTTPTSSTSTTVAATTVQAQGNNAANGGQPGAAGGVNGGGSAAAIAVPVAPPPPPVEMVSRQTVLKPAGSAQPSDQPPTSWQSPPPRPSKRATRDIANADGSTSAPTAAATTPVASTPSTGGAQVAAGGIGRGGASKDPVLGTANIAKAGSAEVSNGYTFFVGLLIAGAILAFALFTYLRANSEDAKTRSR
jgi:hypothetical protein